MINLLRFFTLLLLLSSCSKEVSIAFSTEIFTEESLSLCQEDVCSEITAEYVQAEGNSEVAQRINAQIEDFIIASLFLGEDDQPAAQTIEGAAKQFILAYRDHQTDIPTELDTGPYFADISVRLLFQSEGLISLEMTQYAFTGGAHGYGSTYFLNLHPETGLELQSEDIFTDLAGFVSLADKKFREAHQISEEKNINHTGFMFENDSFYIPDTVGFTEEAVIMMYNPYEIAPYNAGAIELSIPLEEVEEYLKTSIL